MDTIALHGVRAYGRHGADPGERDRPQAFDLDVELELDLTAARRTDDLADTVDYAQVHARIIELVESTSFALLERLGDAIIAMVLEDERVRSVRLTIAKPKLLRGATPSVTLQGRRP